MDVVYSALKLISCQYLMTALFFIKHYMGVVPYTKSFRYQYYPILKSENYFSFIF